MQGDRAAHPMTFVLPDSRYGMTRTNYNLVSVPKELPEYDILLAANRLNEHRYRELTHKQRVFVDAYLAHDFDAAKAASVAGYPADECARVGRRMLKKSEVEQAIKYALQYFTETQKLRFERLVEELRVIALVNPVDLVDPESVELRADLDPENDPRFRAIKKIKKTVTKYGENIEYEFHDKLSAIDKLLKILAPQLADPDDAMKQNGTTNVNVTNVNIVPVPSGQFLPAPVSPYDTAGLTIEHTSSTGPGIQSGP